MDKNPLGRYNGHIMAEQSALIRTRHGLGHYARLYFDNGRGISRAPLNTFSSEEIRTQDHRMLGNQLYHTASRPYLRHELANIHYPINKIDSAPQRYCLCGNKMKYWFIISTLCEEALWLVSNKNRLEQCLKFLFGQLSSTGSLQVDILLVAHGGVVAFHWPL